LIEWSVTVARDEKVFTLKQHRSVELSEYHDQNQQQKATTKTQPIISIERFDIDLRWLLQRIYLPIKIATLSDDLLKSLRSTAFRPYFRRQITQRANCRPSFLSLLHKRFPEPL
jgi:hypothetical protein